VNHGKRGAIKRFDRAIHAAGDNELVELRDKEHALGLREARERVRHTADSQIDHLDGVFCECCEEGPPSLHIDSEMVNAPVDLGQRDRLHEFEGDNILCRCNGK